MAVLALQGYVVFRDLDPATLIQVGIKSPNGSITIAPMASAKSAFMISEDGALDTYFYVSNQSGDVDRIRYTWVNAETGQKVVESFFEVLPFRMRLVSAYGTLKV